MLDVNGTAISPKDLGAHYRETRARLFNPAPSTQEIDGLRVEAAALRLEVSALRREVAFIRSVRHAPTPSPPRQLLPQTPVATVKSVVAAYFKVTVEEIESARRQVSVVLPRHVAIYLAHKLTAQSLPQIAKSFGDRDHTTILSAVRRISERLDADPTLDRQLKEIEAELGRAAHVD